MYLPNRVNKRIVGLAAALLSIPLAVSVSIGPGQPAVAFAQVGAPRGYVNDFAGMFAPGEVADLETKLAAYAQSSGNEIAVVTVPSLGGVPIEDYAEKLFQEWGIGKAKEDNGVLLLIARDDRAVRIEVGYGLEPELTDLESKAIIENIIVPEFRDGRYGEGVKRAVDAMMSALTSQERPWIDKVYDEQPAFHFEWFWLLFFVLIWFASILGRSKSWWAGGVLGGVIGVILGFAFGFLWTGIMAIVFLVPLGLMFDFFVSRAYRIGKETGHFPWWVGGGGGGHGGFGGGGFGGFGGGHSGGGGASGRW